MTQRAPTPPSLAALIDAQIDALDSLAGAVRRGIRGAAEFDALEERASAIGEALRQAFRGSRR